MRGKNQKIVFAVLIVVLAGIGYFLHSLAQGSLRRELTEKRKKVEVELARLRESNAAARAAADEAAAKERTTRNEAKKAEAEKAKSENERAAAEAKAAAQRQHSIQRVASREPSQGTCALAHRLHQKPHLLPLLVHEVYADGPTQERTRAAIHPELRKLARHHRRQRTLGISGTQQHIPLVQPLHAREPQIQNLLSLCSHYYK